MSSLRQRAAAGAVSWLGWCLLETIGRTSRIGIYRAPSTLEREGRGLPIIYAFWHRYQLPMVFVHRNRGAYVLVSQSRDGEYIARALERFGFRTVRGSSSRGGSSAFRELVRVLESGVSVGFTPDGPRGPLRSIAPGLLALAARTGAPVVPVAWAGSRVKEFASWDRFLLPLPFGRLSVVYGEPVQLAGEGPEDEARLREALNGAEKIAADRLARC